MFTMTELSPTEWATKYGVTLDWSATGYHADEDGWEHQRFTLTLMRDGALLEAPWMQGLGIDTEPTLESVLPALVSDAQSGALDFDDFCSEFGYDEDSRRAYSTWQACQKLNKDLYSFMRSEAMWDDFHQVRES